MLFVFTFVFVVFTKTTAWFDRVDGTPLTTDDVETLGCCDADGLYDHEIVYAFTFDKRDDAERFVSSPNRSEQRVENGFVFHNVDRCGPVETHTDDTFDALLNRVCVGDVYHNPTW